MWISVLDEGLTPTVIPLLPQVQTHSRSPVMPDQGGRVIADRVPGLEHAPLELHVLCRPKHRIKAVKLFEQALPEGHVAPRNMQSQIIRQQLRQRTSWTTGDHLRTYRVPRWRHVRST